MVNGKCDNMKPNFIICGTQKGGTTPVMRMLMQHPDVFMHDGEIDYFSVHWWRTPDWYETKFLPAQAIGEKSPSYMCIQSTAKRIYKYNPNMKLIFFLRDPIDRAYSHWSMNKRKGKEGRAFHTCITSKEKINYWQSHAYISRGFYDEQLEIYRKYFAGKMLLIKTEWMYDNTQEAMNTITDFIGVRNFKVSQVKYKTSNCQIDEKDRKMLEEIYNEKSKNYMALKSWMQF